MTATWNDFESDSISETIRIGRFVHDNFLLILDLNDVMNAGGGLIAKLEAMPDVAARNAAMAELSALNGMTYAQFKEISYFVTATLGALCSHPMPALSWLLLKGYDK
jgi:hypothetical protein